MNTQQPSTTWTASQLALTAMLFFWALYEWQGWGAPPPAPLVALSGQLVSGLVSYLVPEKVLLERFRRMFEEEQKTMTGSQE